MKAFTNGMAGRDESVEGCASTTAKFPTAKAEDNGNAFEGAVASGTIYDGETVAGQTYRISGACFAANDIGSNNGWWYRYAATGHWAPADLRARFEGREACSGI